MLARLVGARDWMRLRATGGDGPCRRQEWIAVHRSAHGLGMRTTAEHDFWRGEGMEAARGFSGCGAAACGRRRVGLRRLCRWRRIAPGGRDLDGVTAVERLKTLAISRMFLDNVETCAGEPGRRRAEGAADGAAVWGQRCGFGGGGARFGPGGCAADYSGCGGSSQLQRDMAYRTMFLELERQVLLLPDIRILRGSAKTSCRIV